jgi:hypothetical protein
MKPGFARGNIHHDGGYSPHFAYFPEGSLDEYLESVNLQWSELIAQVRDDYIEMFNQLSFNIFGENTGKDRLYKTREWYLYKAFKWYASLARSRGLSALEEDLLYQYEHFQGSEAELSYQRRGRLCILASPHMAEIVRDPGARCPPCVAGSGSDRVFHWWTKLPVTMSRELPTERNLTARALA